MKNIKLALHHIHVLLDRGNFDPASRAELLAARERLNKLIAKKDA